MEPYKDTLKMRIALLCAGVVVMTAVLIMGETGVFARVGDSSFTGFLRGFQTGILTSVSLVFVFFIARYIRVLGSGEKLKASYYAENDERHKLIMMKTGGTAMYVCTVAILLAGIVAGYFSETAFYSLAGCALFLLVARLILKIYYHKKY